MTEINGVYGFSTQNLKILLDHPFLTKIIFFFIVKADEPNSSHNERK